MRSRAVVVALAALCACSGDDGAGAPAALGGAGGLGAAGSGGAVAMSGASGSAAGAGGVVSGGGAGGVTGGAGGGTPDASSCGTTHASGSRVRLLLAVTAEGDERVHGFHDTLLGIDCTYEWIDEQQARCLPLSLASYFPNASSEYFLDDACSGAPLYAQSASCPSDFLLVYSAGASGACDRVAHLYERGAARPATGALYERTVDGCRAIPELDPSESLYELGMERDLTAYARATWGRWREGGGLAVEGFVGDDGSRHAATYFDLAHDTDCTPLPMEDGELRCLAGDRLSQQYEDAACTQPLFSHYDLCGAKLPSHAFTESETVCGAYALHRVLEPYASDTAYEAIPTCEPGPLPAVESLRHYRTEPADPSEMVALQLETDEADPGRLRRRHFRNAGGACFAAGMQDVELGTTCGVGTAADGALRCLPSGGGGRLVRAFSDAGCTVQAHLVSPDPCGEPVPFVRVTDPDGCVSGTRVLRVLPEPVAAADLPPLYFQRSGSCEQGTLSQGTYLRVGEEVPPESMVAVTLELE